MTLQVGEMDARLTDESEHFPGEETATGRSSPGDASIQVQAAAWCADLSVRLRLLLRRDAATVLLPKETARRGRGAHRGKDEHSNREERH